jgi:acyl-homoserine-lactone acylase
MTMRRSTRTRALAGACAAAALVGLALAGGAPPASASRDGRYAAEIRRTAYGIPHVLAHDYGGLGYGYGYAFAQDDLCVLADQVVTWRGQRSRYFGADAPSTDALGASSTNLASDTYYQGLRRAGTVAGLIARPAPLGPTRQVRALVDGYVAGYDRYLRDTGVADLPDAACRGKAWVGPITALDVWTGLVALTEQSGTAQYRQDIADAAPPAAGSTGTAAVPDETTAPAETGSNGWALGRDATRSHDGMVLANPHVPWLGDARFYQVQLTIPGQLDVSGGSLYGTPLVEIGHTTGLAWTHTATHAQHATLYQLRLVPGDPTSYLVDGRPVAMTRQVVTVPVPGGQTTRTLWSSRYGPVLATGWTTSTAYSLRDANADNTRAMNAWLAIDRSESLPQLRAAQREYQGLPWVYTLATDASGRVWFTDGSVVPDVGDAQRQRCLVRGNPERPDVLDGSTVDCDWGDDPAAVEPGLLGPEHAPTLDRTDYAADSNNSPLYANPNEPLTGYPAVYDSRTDLELRPRLGLTEIAQRIAGTDGLGAPGFTLPTLRAAMLGDRNLSGELGRADVVAMCRAHPVETASDGTAVDVRAACATLAAWDGRDGVDSGGAVLWGAYFESLP